MKRPILAAMFAVTLAAGCGGSSGGGGGGTVTPPGPAGDAAASTVPANGATGVPVTQAIAVTFGKDLDATTLLAANIMLTQFGDAVNVPGTIAYDVPTKTLTFTPTRPMASGGLHTFTIKAAAQTKAAGDDAITFTTQPTPMIFSSTMDPNNPAASVTAMNVWSMQPDGTGLHALTTFPDKAHGSVIGPITWSPDDGRIAFIARENDPDDRADLFIMNADGTGLANLTNGGAKYEVESFKWAPDGTRIFFVFTTDRTVLAAHYDLGAVAPDGSRLANLSTLPADKTANWHSFDLSPDGAKLYTSVRPLSGSAPEDIYAVNADGSGIVNLTNAAATDQARSPLLTPDGTKLYYESSSASSGDGISSMNPDGTGVQTIVAPSANQTFTPWAFSPDGSRLAVVSEGPMKINVSVLLADGSQAPTPLASLTGTDGAYGGTWSPDGSKIAYAYGDPNFGPFDLFVADRDGKGAMNLTNLSAGTLVTNSSQWRLLRDDVLWSPDETQIVYTQVVLGSDTMNIGIAHVDGSGTTALTNFAAPLLGAVAAWW